MVATEAQAKEWGGKNTWLGKDVEFMTENRHTREREGQWDTAGLEGMGLKVVEGDKEAAK